ncbi:G protein-regulated inducer of neurite outgrowth 1 [Discoglossus pictus]
MGSPKKPHTLQLSKPDAVNDNYSLPEKRSPISSRIWQAEDPTRKSGFTGEDLSMRNFCVSVHGDNDLMESFSFDTDADSFLAARRGESVDTLGSLHVHETYENPLNHETLKADLTKTHSNSSPADSIDSEIHKTTQKEIKDILECKEISKKDDAKQDEITSTSFQASADKEVTQKESSCVPMSLDGNITKPSENYADTFGKSFNNLKEKLHVELEMAKDRIASHKIDIDDKYNKPISPESSNLTTKGLSAMEPFIKETKSQESFTSSVKSDIDVSVHMSKIITPLGENIVSNIPICEPQTKISLGEQVSIKNDGDLCTEGPSSQLMHPNEEIRTQGGSKVEYRSIAVSPIIPPEGISSFTFQTGLSSFTNLYKGGTVEKDTSSKEDMSKPYSFELSPPNQDGGTLVQYRSVAVSPIIPPNDSSSFTFQSANNPNKLKGSAEDQRTDIRSTENLPKTYSFELTPPNMDVGTETRVECKSVAVSPIIPPDGSSFTFQTLKSSSSALTGGQETRSVDLLPKTYSFELTPPNQDVGTQADTRAECVSVAVSPIIPPDGSSSSFIFHSEQRHQDLTPKSIADKTGVKESNTLKNQNLEADMQADTRVKYISVAVSPIVPPDGSSSFTFLTEKTAQGVDVNQKKDGKTVDTLPKTYSFELTPPDQEDGAKSTVEYRSIAVSPIVPPDDYSFTFQTEKNKEVTSTVKGSSQGNLGKNEGTVDTLPKTYSFELTPPSQDVGTQAENKVECVSVAVSPFVLSPGPSSFTFQAEQNHQESASKVQDQTIKRDPCSTSVPPQTCSLELKPQNQDVGTQADIREHSISVAVSPMIPAEGSCSFTFHTQGLPNSVCPHMLEKPSMKDAELQVSFPVETRSIATDPMTPKGKSPKASYPEVRVKGTKGDPPEPVREVSWDEKGMTWEVYGASMEVEVLGMAIQKHLEKQIEEHGRQKVMTPQNTRGSSVRSAPVKGEGKRQPSAFRSFFRVRRPHCCSRAGQTIE